MSSVKLYVYDLSRGMARSMSLAWTGKQIDGIWHTSVVVFGREIFYGQGILESIPGQTHHGEPYKIIDMGNTQIDKDTFNEYINSLSDFYTADKYHLMDFNCNNFTQDVIGFLTGGSIPEWISGLPAEFLATPLGQMLKPQIDQMFRRTSTEHRVNPSIGTSTPAFPTPPISRTATPASNLLSSVANAAAGPSSSSNGHIPSATTSQSLTSALELVSASSNFNTILSRNKAVIVNFTNTPGCPPCRMIKPIYESLASTYSTHPQYISKGVKFVEVELSVGEGREISSKYNVSATPTFIFFRDGKKVDEMKGADKNSLQAKIEGFLEDVFPSHIHRKLFLPTIEGLPTDAITSGNIPNYDALISKMEGFVKGKEDLQEDVKALKEKVIPMLEGKIVDANKRKQVYDEWVSVTKDLLLNLKPVDTFPIIDLWRIGLLQPNVITTLVSELSPTSPSQSEPLTAILSLVSSTLSSSKQDTPKPFLLTSLRHLTNLLASLPLCNLCLDPESAHSSTITSVTVDSLLHPDSSVRSAAGGVAINLANYRFRLYKSQTTNTTGYPGLEDTSSSSEYEGELLPALIEALSKETDEDVGYRFLVAICQICFLSSKFEEEFKPLLEVLEAQSVVQAKLKGWKKKEVRKLGEEAVSKMLA